MDMKDKKKKLVPLLATIFDIDPRCITDESFGEQGAMPGRLHINVQDSSKAAARQSAEHFYHPIVSDRTRDFDCSPKGTAAFFVHDYLNALQKQRMGWQDQEQPGKYVSPCCGPNVLPIDMNQLMDDNGNSTPTLRAMQTPMHRRALQDLYHGNFPEKLIDLKQDAYDEAMRQYVDGVESKLNSRRSLAGPRSGSWRRYTAADAKARKPEGRS